MRERENGREQTKKKKEKRNRQKKENRPYEIPLDEDGTGAAWTRYGTVDMRSNGGTSRGGGSSG